MKNLLPNKDLQERNKKKELALQERNRCKERRRDFLQIVATKPFEIQAEKYYGVISKDLDKVNNEYEKYAISNPKLTQLLSLTKVRNGINNYIISTNNSNEYSVNFDNDLSLNKMEQYKSALGRNPDAKGFEKLKIRLYIITEWIMEDWSKRNNLDHLDYNATNPFSPQDCNVAGVDIDVKTTVSVGNYWQIRSYFTRNEKIVENEIQVAIKSHVSSYENPHSYHYIHGIFDPKIYNKVDLHLNYLRVTSKFKNPCYFHPLQDYFFTTFKCQNMKYDEDVINYWISPKHANTYPDFLHPDEPFMIDLDTIPNYNLIAIIHSIIDSPKSLNSFLESQLEDFHYDLIPIIIELVNKKLIHLFPHYFADYLLNKIKNKERIDTEKLTDIAFSIFWLNDDQKKYINNLIMLAEIMPRVRCKWHPEENIKDMEINFIDGHIPTFHAICSHDPQKKTTIYSYSWRTGQTVIYKKEDLCPTPNCGGLTHKLKDLIYCKAGCQTYGRTAHESIKSTEISK